VGKGEDVKRVRLESLSEGQCVQMLHVGPYEKECETIAVMKTFAEKKQLEFSGKHHEITSLTRAASLRNGSRQS